MRNRDVNKKWWFLPQKLVFDSQDKVLSQFTGNTTRERRMWRWWLKWFGAPQTKNAQWQFVAQPWLQDVGGDFLSFVDSWMWIWLNHTYWCAELQSLEQNAQSSVFFFPPDVPCWFSIRFTPELGALPGTIVVWLTAIERCRPRGFGECGSKSSWRKHSGLA